MPQLQTVAKTVRVQTSVTRPANTTAYAAGDVIDLATGAGLNFANVARGSGLGGLITGAVLHSSANQTTKALIELWLFRAALAAYDNDNAAFTPTDADLDELVGILEFLTPFVGDASAGASGNLAYHAERIYLPMPFVAAAADRDLYGVLVVRNAYTPVSAEKFTVTIEAEQA